MINKIKMQPLIVIALALGLAGCSSPETPTNTPITPTTSPVTPTIPVVGCNAGDQAPFVYHDSRLTKVTDCSHVIGLVDALRQEADGDIHLALQCANEECRALLTPGNTTNQHGDLVVEFICVYPVTQQDAQQPCAADPDPFKPSQAPKAGQCIWIDGRGVSDGVHGWGEVHPVGAFGEAAGECSGLAAKIFTLEAEPDDGE